MSHVTIVGATGSLGAYLTAQAAAAGHDVSVAVRTPSKLSPELRKKVRLHEVDLARASAPELAALFRDQDAVLNAAGQVTEGQRFVDLVARVVAGLESLPDPKRPVCWFLAGAALLDLDDQGRRGVDFQAIATTYWPHRANYDRIRETALDWRLLCPGPMVHQPPLGLDRMRVSLDRVPVAFPVSASLSEAELVPLFVQKVPEMIVSYADAAALILAHLDPSDDMSRHRVGMALPIGMRGIK